MSHPNHLNGGDQFYHIRGADLYLIVEKTFFCVHSYFFRRDSDMFRAILDKPCPPGEEAPGSSDVTAIVLDSVTPDEFKIFLWVFYNPKYSLYDETAENWITILSLAQRWQFHEVKTLAIRELQAKRMDLIDRIILYHKYHVDDAFIIPLYAELVSQEHTLSAQDSAKLGMQRAVPVFQARERIRANPSYGGKSPLPSDRQRDILGVARAIMKELPVTNGASSGGSAGGKPNGKINGV
ncbi:hypothetical protein C8J56DRAFT_421299 [Mycena floridula]|nr:hypothetical protein C8J56DRAFT_421299 [Mycena floridula]